MKVLTCFTKFYSAMFFPFTFTKFTKCTGFYVRIYMLLSIYIIEILDFNMLISSGKYCFLRNRNLYTL